MAMSKGVMKMRPLENGLVIEPGKTIKLAPGGYHMMLMDLKSPLKQQS
jgi:copper(I)-binding protein